MARVFSKVRPKTSRYKVYSRKKKTTRGTKDVVLKTNMVPGLSVPRSIYGFPSSMTTKLRYADVVPLTYTSTVTKYSFGANNVFDPDFTGTGHQPYFYDQITPLFNRYVVLGSKITVTFLPVSSTVTPPSGPGIVGIIGDNNAGVSSVATTLMEGQNSVSKFISAWSGTDLKAMVMATYSPEISLGISSDDDTVAALVSAGPAKTWFFTLYCQDYNSTTSSALYAKVNIEYTVRFTEPIEPAGS